MRLTRTLEERFKWKSVATALLLVVVAAMTLEATSLIQYFYAEKGLREEATKRAESQLENTRLKIDGVLDQVEATIRNTVRLTQWGFDHLDSLDMITSIIVRDNPVVTGSTVALVPGYSRKHPLFAPYSYKDQNTGEILSRSLATEEYDYPSKEWFTKAIEADGGYWSEPYLDVGGGEVLMTTYSVPVRDSQGKVAAVLTADIALDWLTNYVGGSKVYPDAFNLVVSREGEIMVSPVETLVLKGTLLDVANRFADSSRVKSLSKAMLGGKSGMMEIRSETTNNHVYFAPVERTGWSMSIIIPDKEIFGEIKSTRRLVEILQLLGLTMLILILSFAAKSQNQFKTLSENKEKMENELTIAKGIQMSMIPKTFPPFPERDDLDMSAVIVPAKEVGGDLYDYFIRNEKLYFCIGDVSGKGVPAALVMAVTRSLFRSVANHENSARHIVEIINKSMLEMNDNNMFVTFFCGILNLENGHLDFCNAGHNNPVLISGIRKKLEVIPNLPLGVLADFKFESQEIVLKDDDALFLYTDGLSEAENIDHKLFGEDRMMNVLSTRRDAAGHLKAMAKEVSDFVGEAPRSDDLTMLFIHYINSEPGVLKRHLVIKNDISQISRLEKFISGIAASKNLDEALATNINLALEEAVTNSVMYAYPEGTEGEIEIKARVDDNEIEFILSDNGIEFDPTARPEPDITASAELRPIGGLGIFLVKNIMDSVTYRREDGTNNLIMIKKLK
ncbi:MAG: SpoIIE family protein phosphatase [Bacteroidales bacterium]|nr:SpoIIE family protein phosphatase [Bacteroidales bacterium]